MTERPSRPEDDRPSIDPTTATVSGLRRGRTCAAGITGANLEVGGNFTSADRCG